MPSKTAENSIPSCWLIAKVALEDNNGFDAGAPGSQKKSRAQKERRRK
jgi:hypothetical protein